MFNNKKVFLTLFFTASTATFFAFQNFTYEDNSCTMSEDYQDDLLVRLSKKFNRSPVPKYYLNENKQCVPYNVNGSLVFQDYGNGKAEFHASMEPEISANSFTDVTEHSKLVNHPIGGSLVELIDNTPTGASINVAVYIFKNTKIISSLFRAYTRGVTVRVITTTEGDKAVEKLNFANESWIKQCPNKIGNSNGGCLGRKLMHHKFVTFSEICRKGLNPDKTCFNSESFKNVVFQGSWNFGNIKKHEMASVFLGAPKIYESYQTQFERMHLAIQNPGQEIPFDNTVKRRDSNFQIHFMPILRNDQSLRSFSDSDLFVSILNKTTCTTIKNERRTVLRLANTHWENSPSRPVAGVIIEALKRLVQKGCVVKILLPADMAPIPSSTANKIHVSDKDSTIFNALVATGADVRTFAQAANAHITDSSNAAHMHAKYAMIESPIASESSLMFGTMSFTTGSQDLNDEVWIDWKNPSTIAFNFYRDTFDKLWENLPPQPSCKNLSASWTPKFSNIRGLWDLNGNLQKEYKDDATALAQIGPHGKYKNDAYNLFIKGINGQGISFNASKSYVTIPHDQALAPTDKLTLSFWLKYETQTSPGIIPIVSKAQDGGYQIDFKDNELRFLIKTVDPKKSSIYEAVKISTKNFKDKAWYHIAGIFDGKSMKVFVNGDLKGDRKVSGKIIYTHQNRFCVGRGTGDGNCSGEFGLNGAIDDVAIFNTDLQEKEILLLAKRPAFCEERDSKVSLLPAHWD